MWCWEEQYFGRLKDAWCLVLGGEHRALRVQRVTSSPDIMVPWLWIQQLNNIIGIGTICSMPWTIYSSICMHKYVHTRECPAAPFPTHSNTLYTKQSCVVSAPPLRARLIIWGQPVYNFRISICLCTAAAAGCFACNAASSRDDVLCCCKLLINSILDMQTRLAECCVCLPRPNDCYVTFTCLDIQL